MTVSEHNPAAVRLYERVGFRHAGRTTPGLLAMVWTIAARRGSDG